MHGTILVTYTSRGGPLDADQQRQLVHEAQSALEWDPAFGIDITRASHHQGDVVGALTAWATDDTKGYDALIDTVHGLGLIDEAEHEQAEARRLPPGHPAYQEPIDGAKLRADLAAWLPEYNDGERWAAHLRLLTILREHKLLP